jgi:hypothetical protein
MRCCNNKSNKIINLHHKLERITLPLLSLFNSDDSVTKFAYLKMNYIYIKNKLVPIQFNN